jgi:predicted transposase/invertase (TIGR01784 family)
MEVHTLELPKVPADADALLPQWMRLIAASSYQELEEVRQADSAIGEVVDMIWELSEEESVRIQEEKKEKYRRDMVAVRLQGLDEGRAEGMEAGRAEGRASVVSAMLSNGLSAAEVAKLTGIGVEEVMALA